MSLRASLLVFVLSALLVIACGKAASAPPASPPGHKLTFVPQPNGVLPAPGSLGNVLTSTGSAWASSAPAGGTVLSISNVDNALSAAATTNDGDEPISVRFVITKTMVVTGVRVVQFSGSSHTPQCGVWSSSGTLLGSATGSSTASGTAVTVSFTPVTLLATPPDTATTAGKEYMAGCYLGYGASYAFNATVPHVPPMPYAPGVWIKSWCFAFSASFTAPTNCSTTTFYSVDPVFQ